ncbi:sigma-70 family RNA polymerase sigma factor [Actinospica acidithermotolerans]|uniref:sigma-70 family RNA polymerase sigma factor n=1 Tax=Actinospica acidithermotolerans TaxID=2828514 RepID=UPI001BA533BE|nr:sigma-70 family RNA polymerase sigma factor [Actinospica acidithermotolerans]
MTSDRPDPEGAQDAERTGDALDTSALLHRAQTGDSRAFDELIAGYQSELRAHCYRMLGSIHDADDALQDAVFRAWKGLSGYRERGTVRAWLYSIATNTALDIATHRSRRELPAGFGPAADAGAELEPPSADIPWLEPYPDQWLTSPDARFEQRESVELAFVIALQSLPPLQRAVLLLREVIGFTTAEIADQLNTSAASVNSALQRARASVRAHRPDEATQRETLSALGEQRTRALAHRYVDAMERGDVDAIISMLTADATWSMPPVPTYFRGHEAIASFLSRYPLTRQWRHLPARANGHLAVACYMYDPGRQAFLPHCIDVLTLRGDKISAVTAFLDADFEKFGLPVEGAERAWLK